MSYIKLYTDELKNKGLSLYDKAVYCSLMTKYQYHHYQEFYTFEKYIADELEISERTVQRSIKKLIDTNLITIRKQYHKQLKQTVNYYILTGIQSLTDENLDTSTDNDDIDTTTTANDITEHRANNDDIQGYIDDDEQTDNEKIIEAIEEKYNISPDEFFKDINKIPDIKFSVLEEISDISNTNPQAVLDYIKEIRKIA